MGLISTFIRLDSYCAAVFTTVKHARPILTAVHINYLTLTQIKARTIKHKCLFNVFKSLIRKNVKMTFCK